MPDIQQPSTWIQTIKSSSMKIMIFHVPTFFWLMFQIKLKKVMEYLFAICVFVYLCIEFISVT